MSKVPPLYKKVFWRLVGESASCSAYEANDGLTLIVAIEDGRWHMSIAHPNRDPTWIEIRDARYQFIPDEAHMAMILPPEEEYVNAHEHCFHLWEIKERW